MKKVMTFLGLDGALSCAAFLNKYPDFDIIVCSTNNFLFHLQKLYEENPKEIIILGAGPGYNKDDMDVCQTVFSKFSKKSVRITYIAHFDLSFITKNIKDKKKLQIKWETGKELYDIVVEHFNINNKFKKFLQAQQKTILACLEEVKFRFFNFNNRDFYPEFLKRLSQYEIKDSLRVLDNNSHFYNSNFLFGKSHKVISLKKKLEKIGEDSFCNVLICGESGTGKTTLAYSIHFASKRKGRFEVISCANFQENLLESKLFGWEKGAFTGADKASEGLFELADGGTLFMDEIGEMPFVLQSKLLRVLQDGKFKRVGGKQEKSVDVRIIAATNRDLGKMIKDNQFRADLYYRIASIELNSIPLREQIDDIGYISNFILRKIYEKRDNTENFKSLEKYQVDILKKYNWPGNVRQLQNALERAYILDEWDFNFLDLKKDDLKTVVNISEYNFEGVSDNINDLETIKEKYINKVFLLCDRNITKTAEILKISKKYS